LFFSPINNSKRIRNTSIHCHNADLLFLDKGKVSYKLRRMENILLLMGTNVGNLKTNLLTALKLLDKNEIKVVKKSKIYRTRPVGNEDQPDFLNVALEVECPYEPLELLRVLKRIESHMGRKRTRRWGPRVIDIDILFYGDRIIKRKELEIPHREFFNRTFAIKLCAEIAPDFVPPKSKKCIKDYLEE